MVKYQFGNFEVEFDPTDVAFVEKYEAVAESYATKLKALPLEKKASEVLIEVCKNFFETFDGLFGEGTSEQMFGGKQSVDLCIKALQKLVDIMYDYTAVLKKLTNEVGNRATKRAKTKK